MAFEENPTGRAFIRRREKQPTCRISVLLILLAVVLAFLLVIFMFHPEN
jgi:hypothetical protein